MKMSAPVIPSASAVIAKQVLPQNRAERSALSIWSDLVKLRLTTLVLLTTLVGFYMGTVGTLDLRLMFFALVGTAFVACGASALNQLWEREHDARMQRTQERPLPAGRMQPLTVLMLGIAWSVGGLLLLATTVNILTCILGAATLLIYIFVYTPLKRVTWLNTIVGAVPGALPPLIGWTAAQNDLSGEGLALFGILFFWQITHFLAIAWLYRDEYQKAGFVMLSTIDPEGRKTGQLSLLHNAGLVGVSLFPLVYGMTGSPYLIGCLVLGTAYLWFTLDFARKLTLNAARKAFCFSIIYLPLLLILLVLDKVKFYG